MRSRSSSNALHGLLALFTVTAAGLLSGCGGAKMTIKVDAAADTNGGQPLYMVVRQAEEAKYVTEDYGVIAAKVFATPADPDMIQREVIYPGDSKKVSFEKPKDKPVAIYFLFTKPGERWKTARPQPLPSSVDIELSGNTIKNDS
ncbi:MAG TPA: hypothetical protein VHF22_07400 [Planctomycetota bacterium]|nr:hypothetical protein [Planctomycetota bacterium]